MHRARSLARKLGSNHLKDIRELDTSADIILLAVPDDAIPAILKSIPATKQLIVHTAGNVPLSVFGRKFPNAGVFYPLQSFSADRPLRMRHIPILIEAHPQLRRKLNLLGKSISEEVVAVSSEQRQWLHLAAVISNNFTNHLLYLSSSSCNDIDCPSACFIPSFVRRQKSHCTAPFSSSNRACTER